MSQNLNIAIVSTNKNKYSETFIHNHIHYLPGNIHFLFDGYLPAKYSTDKGHTENSFVRKKSKLSLFKQKPVNEKQALIDSIASYLVKNHIQVLLCQYGPSGVEMLPVALKTSIPLVVHFHGYDAYRNDILSSYGKNYEALFQQSATIICVSKHMKQQLIRLNCPEQKIHVLPYAPNIPISKKTPLEKKRDFVFFGRLVAKKAPPLMLKAFSQVVHYQQTATLAIIGDGELLHECQQLAKELGIEKQVAFMGALPHNHLISVVSASKIHVQLSITTADNDMEGTPVSLLEAGALRLPSVVSRHGGMLDVITDGENGFLVNENDADEAAKKMLLLLNDGALREKMGNNAQRVIIENFDFKKYILSLFEVLKNTSLKN